jgi:pyruvate/2-oxoglutarate dehydrogenase complex dihydrolipoamide dehydrogenase (E3) component
VLAVEGTTPVQAWDVIAQPSLVPEGAAVAIIGGGIVGLEVADVLLSRGCRMTVLEVAPTLAPQMARNNRTDLLIRLREAGVGFHTKARVQRLQGNTLVFSVDGKAQGIEADLVIAAIGAVPDRDVLPAVEATGIPYTLVGDANLPGDFLSVLRDASMTGLGIGLPSERL